MTNNATPNSQGMDWTTCSMEAVSEDRLPAMNVSPIHAMPKMAITACIPAEKILPCTALMPSIRKTSRMVLSMTISMMDGMSSGTFFPSDWNTGRKASTEPNSTIRNVANRNIPTDMRALRTSNDEAVSTNRFSITPPSDGAGIRDRPPVPCPPSSSRKPPPAPLSR